MKKNRLFFILILSLVFTFSTQAQVIGLWKGDLHIANQTLKMNVKFYDDNGKIAGNLDIPQQSAMGLKLTNIEESGNNIKFEFVISSTNILQFDGNVIGDSLKGNFQQRGIPGKFELKKETEDNNTTKNEMKKR